MFAEQIPSVFLKAGLASLEVDLGASTTRAIIGPTGRIILERVDMVCKISGVVGWDSQLNVGPVTAQIEKLTVVITDPGLSSETILITASASISIGSLPVVASMKATLAVDQEPEIEFALTGSNALQQICGLLDTKSQLLPKLESLEVPLSKEQKAITSGDLPSQAECQDTSTKSASSLRKLKSLQTETVGFSLRQPAKQLNSYIVSDIFAAVNLENWKEYLPVSFPRELKPPTIRLQVTNPFSELRGVAVVVQTTYLTTIARRPEVFDVQFSAMPLVLPREREYRVQVAARGQGLSIWDVVDKIGVALGKDDLLSGVPIIEQILSTLYIKNISVAVESFKHGWKFGDWLLQLGVPSLNLIPSGNIKLRDIDIIVMKEFGVISASFKGLIDFPKAERLVYAALETPRDGVAGSIEISCTDGLSLMHVWEAFELPDIKDVPVVREIMSVRLKTAYLTVANVTKDGRNYLTPTSAHLTFLYGALDLGLLTINSLEVSLGYVAAREPDIVEKRSFSLDATVADMSLRAGFSYDTSTKELIASLLPIKKLSIASTVDILLSEDFRKYNVLHDILGGLGLDQVSLEMAASKGYPIKQMLLEVSNTETLQVGVLILKRLRVKYKSAAASEQSQGTTQLLESFGGSSAATTGDTRKTGKGTTNTVVDPSTTRTPASGGKSADSGAEGTPKATLDIHAEITKDETQVDIDINCVSQATEKTAAFSIRPGKNSQLMMRGVLGLFCIEEKNFQRKIPANCTDCFDVAIEYIGGKVVLVKDKATQKTSLELRVFELTASSKRSFNVISDPQIQVKDISLHVKYDSEGTKDTPKGLSGMLSAHFWIKKTDIFMEYIWHPTFGNAFIGKKVPDEQTQILDLALAAQMSQENFQTPSNLQGDVTVKEINIIFLPERYIEVSGSVAAWWRPLIGGLTLNLEQLSAVFRLDFRKLEELPPPAKSEPATRAITALDKDNEGRKSHYEVWLTGKLRVEKLVALEAWLWITSPRNIILAATLSPILYSTGHRLNKIYIGNPNPDPRIRG